MYTHVFEITPDDTEGTAADAFMVEGDGTVTILPSSSSTPVTLTVAAGVIYEIAVSQVRASGTTVDRVYGLA